MSNSDELDHSLDELDSSDEQLLLLMEAAEQREHAARRRALLYTVIPIVMAALLLSFTGWQVSQAVEQLEQANQQLDLTNAELRDKKAELASANAELEQANQRIHLMQQELTDTLELVTQTQQELSQTQRSLEQAQGALEQKKQEVDDLQEQLDDLTEQINEARKFQEFQFTEDWELTLKETAVAYPVPQAELLMSIDRLYMWEDISWNPRGASPEEGFNSPTFVAYVLEENGLLGVPASSIQAQSQLMAALPARSGPPQIGDVVFYEGGYSMFYFEDQRGNAFVMGMTPRGIMALQPDFLPVIGYGAVFP